MTEARPAPLTPPAADLRDFPHTPLFRARLFGSTFHSRATDSEWRAGVTLWLKSWDQVPAGSLPDDDIDLCRLAELARDLKTWKKLKAGALRGWVLCSDGRLYHPVVAEGVNNAIEAKAKQRAKTAKARISALEKHLKEAATDADRARITDEIRKIQQTMSQGLSQTLSQGPREGEGKEKEKEKGYISPSSPPAADPPAASAGADTAQKGGARKKHGTPEDHDVARWLFSELQAKHPTVREPNFDGWANDVRLMREQDGRSHRDICGLFRWAQADAFWTANVMSPDKLREKWEQLAAKRDQAARRPPPAPSAPPAKFAAAAAAIYGTGTPPVAAPSTDEGVIDVEARQAA